MKFRADFHTHTNHSFDCQTSVRQHLLAAKKAGLSALAITDHDTVSAIPEAQKIGAHLGLQIIPGVEITVEGGTHIVALFVNKYPRELDIHAVLEFIHEEGGISMLPHVYRSDTGLIYNHTKKGQFSDTEIDDILKKVDLIEVNNFKSQLRGEAWPLDIIKKYNKPMLSNTDAHYSFELGKSYTLFELETELTPELVRGAPRMLGYYPITSKLVVKKQVPLAHYQPQVSSVTCLKKIVPASFVSTVGKGFSKWQQYGRRVEKARQLETVLKTLSFQEVTPEAMLNA